MKRAGELPSAKETSPSKWARQTQAGAAEDQELDTDTIYKRDGDTGVPSVRLGQTVRGGKA